MRPVVYSITDASAAAKTSAVCPLDLYISPSNVALGVVVSGTVSYTVQYTFDDVFAPGYNPASGNWTDHPSLTAQTATKDSNIAYPVRGIRLKQNSGSGTTTLTIIQAGGGGNA
jgi:hypothetical protein